MINTTANVYPVAEESENITFPIPLACHTYYNIDSHDAFSVAVSDAVTLSLTVETRVDKTDSELLFVSNGVDSVLVITETLVDGEVNVVLSVVVSVKVTISTMSDAVALRILLATVEISTFDVRFEFVGKFSTYVTLITVDVVGSLCVVSTNDVVTELMAELTVDAINSVVVVVLAVVAVVAVVAIVSLKLALVESSTGANVSATLGTCPSVVVDKVVTEVSVAVEFISSTITFSTAL